MENYTRIYLEGFGNVELYDNVPVSLNYSVAEIQDISKKNTSFSKTIVLPGTKNNNELLGQLFDVSVSNSNFDINRKVPCTIYGADIVLMKGYFRLVAINKVSPTSIGGEELIEYEVLVFDQTTDFYDKLSDRLLSDLDFSQYNHTYGYSAIVGSSAHTSSDIYTYPMLYNGNTTYYTTTDFQPAIYLKSYIDAAFNEIQYSYESDFLNSDYFKSLIIPFNGEKIKNNLIDVDSRKFQVGWTGATDSYLLSASTTATTYSNSGVTLSYNADNNTTIPYYDSGNTYNVSNYRFTSPSNQIYDFRFKIKADVWMTNPHAQQIKLWDVFGNATLANPKLYCQAKLYKNGVVLETSAPLFNYSFSPTLSVGSTTQSTVTLDTTFAGVQAGINDYFELRLFPFVQNPLNSSWRLGTLSTGAIANPNFNIRFDLSQSGQTAGNNFFINQPHVGELIDGDTVELNEFIPKNVKIKDLFSSVLKMHNLYVEQDKNFENKLLIKTREQYYSGNTAIDWTQKLALDKDINIKFIPELQSKDLILTYKQDSDEYNKYYFDNTKEIYGQKKYIFDNDFLSGEKKIELIFSPTPIKNNGFQLPVSAILSQSPKNNIRILQKPNTWISHESRTWSYKYITTGGATSTATFNTYPYAGHFNKPQFPTVDINFGETSFLMYDEYGNITDNNLANNYYFNQVDQMLDGKLMTAYFDLDYIDILNLKFSDKVFIKDNYYIINKISDYNPINNGLTKVELLKIDDGLKFRTKNRKLNRPLLDNGLLNASGVTVGVGSPNIGTTLGDTQGKYDPVTLNTGSIVVGNSTTNSVKSNRAVVIGDGNTVSQETKSFIIGDGNIVDGGSKSMVIGSGNTISSDSNSMAFGNDNIIPIGVQGAFILGDGITADTSNTIYTNNIVISSGGTINGVSVSGVTSGLPGVLAIDNTTGANDIIIDAGQLIKDATSNSTIELGDGFVTLYSTGINNVSSNLQEDLIFLDPTLSNNGTGFQSFDTVTGFQSQFYIKPTEIQAVNEGIINFTSNFTLPGITDNISIDPQILGNGTGIHSENSSTFETSRVQVLPDRTSLYSEDSSGPTVFSRVQVEPFLITIDSPNIKLDSNFTGTSIANLGIDINGNITTGATAGILGSFLPLTGGTMTGDIIMGTQKYIKNSGGTSTISTGVLGDPNRLDLIQYNGDFINTVRLKNDIQLNAYDDATGENHLQYVDSNNGFTFEDSIGSIFGIKRDALNIFYTPTTVNTNTGILTRNTSTGILEIRDESSIGVGTFVPLTGGTMTGGLVVNSTLSVTGTSTTRNITVNGDIIQNQSSAAIVTTDATVTTIKTIPLSSSNIYQIEANILGIKDNSNTAITSKLIGTFLRDSSGIVSKIGDINEITNTTFTTANVQFVISFANVLIRVTGENSTTISWASTTIVTKLQNNL
jgi:hypothetical protein